MLIFLITFSHEAVNSLYVQKSQPLIRFQSIGLTKNATLSFDLECSIPNQTIALFIVSYKEANLVSQLNPSLYDEICGISDKTTLFQSSPKILFNYFEPSHLVLNSSDKGIYIPFLLNCNRSIASYNFSIHFSNNDSPLDIRYQHYPELYLIFIVIFSIIHLIWLMNGIHFHMFRIPLHTIFTFLPAVHVLHCIFQFIGWFFARKGQHYQKYFIISSIFCFFTLFFMFLSISLVSTGICIFRSSIPKSQFFSSIISASLISFGLINISISNSILKFLINVFISATGFIWFIKISFLNFLLLRSLYSDINTPKNRIVKLKIQLAYDYVYKCLMWMVLILCGYVLFFFVDFSGIGTTAVLEIGCLVNSLMQMNSFLFRHKYFGEGPDSTRVIHNHKLVCLSSPLKKSFVILEDRYQ